LDLPEPLLRLVQQFANIVEHRLTFLPDHKKVINLFEKNNKIQCYLKLLFVFQFSDSYVSPQIRSTAGLYSDPPAVPFQEPINYSTSDSSSSSPPQSGWIAAANCPQEVTQSNYSDGFQPDQQQQQQDYSCLFKIYLKIFDSNQIKWTLFVVPSPQGDIPKRFEVSLQYF
jgi:hypothetical protein